jgi:hypothetical protein
MHGQPVSCHHLGVLCVLSLTPWQVKFVHGFNPSQSMGNVERWLIECEAAMRETVKVDELVSGVTECAVHTCYDVCRGSGLGIASPWSSAGAATADAPYGLHRLTPCALASMQNVTMEAFNGYAHTPRIK